MKDRIKAKAKAVHLDIRRKTAFIEKLINKEQFQLKSEIISDIEAFNLSKRKQELFQSLINSTHRENLLFVNMQRTVSGNKSEVQKLVGLFSKLRSLDNADLQALNMVKYNPGAAVQELIKDTQAEDISHRIIMWTASEIQETEALRKLLIEQKQVVKTLLDGISKQIHELDIEEKEVKAEKYTDQKLGELFAQFKGEVVEQRKLILNAR